MKECKVNNARIKIGTKIKCTPFAMKTREDQVGDGIGIVCAVYPDHIWAKMRGMSEKYNVSGVCFSFDSGQFIVLKY